LRQIRSRWYNSTGGSRGFLGRIGDDVGGGQWISGANVPVAKKWNGIPGATAVSLTLSNIQLTDAGSYALVATSSAGKATSRFARLMVLLTQPNSIVCKSVVFPTGVTAGGKVSLDYLLTNVGTEN
jgi:hypothetical protein